MNINEYFDLLNNEVKEAYGIATLARSQGRDPESFVDIPLAKNKAERCINLVGSIYPELIGKGIPDRIHELESKYEAGDWRVALTIASEVSDNKFCKFNSLVQSIDAGIRVGLAYVTLGTVSAPLEGFVETKIKKTRDNKDYLAIYFAGPIRASGGTAAAVCVLIADYLRSRFKLAKYDVADEELMRYVYEVSDYHNRVSRLQYFPSEEELIFLIKRVGVEVNGDSTTDFDVSNGKDLVRVETNGIRGGMCLVLCEGVAQKAKKLNKNLSKWGVEFGFNEWSWLEEFLKIQKSAWSDNKKSETSKLEPDYKFIQDAVAGRPLFSFPLTRGGFRLRYGRTRFTGHECLGFNPATMYLCNEFIAIGTQLKLERPGKGCTVTPCEYIDGPIVELDDGSVRKINSFEEALSVKNLVNKILFIGDVLVNYGAFKEHGHKLLPSPYVEEWWALELKEVLKTKGYKILSKDRLEELSSKPFTIKPSFDEAVAISREYKIPLHPDYIYYYDLAKEDLIKLSKTLSNEMPVEIKPILNLLGVPHKVINNQVILNEPELKCLKLALNNLNFKEGESVFQALSRTAGLTIRNKALVFIGGRMGRPEKVKLRSMKGTPHVMFPCGYQGGRLRSFNNAVEVGFVEGDFPANYCAKCGKETILNLCESCGSITRRTSFCRKCGKQVSSETHCGEPVSSFKRQKIDIARFIDTALKNLDVQMPPLLKGVRGTSNKTHVTEPLEKGLIRAKNNLYVNKDATIRIDFTELSLTHFKPCEVGASIDKLRLMGYAEDIYGKQLVSDDQVLELKPQDIIVSACKEFHGADAVKHLVNIASFVDELLVKFYKLKPYYNIKSRDDLIGKLVICLAPHTSAGVVGRIIGFSQVQALIAHPYMHAGCRRDCDGDELAIMLLMDALLNFSRQYLPDKRGGRAMDAPLVLTTNLNPLEVDDEVYDFDTAWSYSLDFYNKSLEFVEPSAVSVDSVGKRLGKPEQYYGFGFTHPVDNINSGVRVTSYKRLITMSDKINSQMDLAVKLQSVNPSVVAGLIIEKHFLRDIKGNLRKFTNQSFRCISCASKFRRVPLIGKCPSCGGKIVLTVSEGAVTKYLGPSLLLASKYGVPDYLNQSLEILKRRVEGVFGWETEKQTGLKEFF